MGTQAAVPRLVIDLAIHLAMLPGGFGIAGMKGVLHKPFQLGLHLGQPRLIQQIEGNPQLALLQSTVKTPTLQIVQQTLGHPGIIK